MYVSNIICSLISVGVDYPPGVYLKPVYWVILPEGPQWRNALKESGIPDEESGSGEAGHRQPSLVYPTKYKGFRCDKTGAPSVALYVVVMPPWVYDLVSSPVVIHRRVVGPELGFDQWMEFGQGTELLEAYSASDGLPDDLEGRYWRQEIRRLLNRRSR